MVVLIQSQTCPVNPAGATPVLTTAEFWEAMLMKCREPQRFIAPIIDCKVLEETATTIKREVMFKGGMGPPSGKTIENISLHAPWKADFYTQDNGGGGGFVNNTLSQGQDETDLYLTFYFEWVFPEVEEGSAEAKERLAQLWKQAKGAVQGTIDHTREMKKKGEIKGLFKDKY